MAYKRIRVSGDDGTTYYTLPGSTGDMRRELSAVNDTVFGQEYQSETPSIGNWQVTTNAFFKGVAGYVAVLKQGGTPVAMSNEATTLVSGKTYQITADAHRLIDMDAAVTVKDGSTTITAQVESIDYLSGTVTLKAAYTVTGSITISGNYVPTVSIAKGRTFTLTQTAAELDTTDYDVAQANGGWRTYDPGLKTVSLEVGGVYDATAGAQAALASRKTVFIDIQPTGSSNVAFRGMFRRMNLTQQGDVGALEEQTLSFNLYVPDSDLLVHPFSWYFANANVINPAVREILAAWQGAEPIKVQYLPDGIAGFEGNAIVTEATLSNSYEGQNEFKATFRGSGAPATV